MTAPEADLILTTGPAANGGSCVARHDGRVVFVRYALPDEVVRVRVVSERGSYWHADVVEVIEPSPDRIDPLCTIAGRDGAVIGIDRFGESAPEKALWPLFGFTIENVVATVGRVLA